MTQPWTKEDQAALESLEARWAATRAPVSKLVADICDAPTTDARVKYVVEHAAEIREALKPFDETTHAVAPWIPCDGRPPAPFIGPLEVRVLRGHPYPVTEWDAVTWANVREWRRL